MRKLLLLSLLTFFVTSCYPTPKPFPVENGVWSITPTTVKDFAPISSVNGSNFDLDLIPPSTEHDFQGVKASPSGSSETALFEVSVPASTKPTRIRVSRHELPIYDKALTNKPAYTVQSSNPGVTVVQPKKPLFWRWVAFIVGAVLLIFVLVQVLVQKLANFSILGIFKRFL